MDIEDLLEQAEDMIRELKEDYDEPDYTSAYEFLDKIIRMKPDCSRAYLLKASLDLNVDVDDLYDSDEPLEENSNFVKAYRYATEEEKKELDYLLDRNLASIEYYDDYDWKTKTLQCETKLCPHCRKEIPLKARVCPICGKYK